MTIFSKIIKGEIPSFKIAASDKYYAFLDINPSAMGHTLIVPTIETDKLFDLPSDYLNGLLPFAQPIAKAIQKAFPCNRVNIITVGFEVPHAHLHLIPMNGMGDMPMLGKKIAVTAGDLAEIQKKNYCTLTIM